MKIAIISLGSTSSQMIAKACEKYFEKVDMLDIRRISCQMKDDKNIILYEGEPIKEEYDSIYVRGSSKYIHIQRAITRAYSEKVYMPLKEEAFSTVHDKFLTLLKLQGKGIDMPKTYVAATTESAKKILAEVSYPIILKIPHGTHGKGVMFADSLSSAKTILDSLEVFKQPYIIQEFIDTKGEDVRLLVIDKKVVAAMKRKADINEVRANIHMGGKGEDYLPKPATIEAALNVAEILECDILAVDILEEKKPYVLEANISPGLQGITQATGLNIADMFAKMLYEKSLNLKESRKNKKFNNILNNIEPSRDTKHLETEISVKGGVIRLPSFASSFSKIKDKDEVFLKIKEGNIEIIKK